MPPDGELGDWIVKPASARHPFVPLNEFTAMSLAQSAGVKPHLEDTIDKARVLWPRQLTSLPKAAAHKKI
jgi:serine/threonine-protein kinase HipA